MYIINSLCHQTSYNINNTFQVDPCIPPPHLTLYCVILYARNRESGQVYTTTGMMHNQRKTPNE